jgi:hypothetical protein
VSGEDYFPSRFLVFRARRARIVAMGEMARRKGLMTCRVRESEEGYVSVAERIGRNVYNCEMLARCLIELYRGSAKAPD